jgi:hypothetical protein
MAFDALGVVLVAAGTAVLAVGVIMLLAASIARSWHRAWTRWRARA